MYEIGELMSYRKHVMYSGEHLCRDLVRNVRETGRMEWGEGICWWREKYNTAMVCDFKRTEMEGR